MLQDRIADATRDRRTTRTPRARCASTPKKTGPGASKAPIVVQEAPPSVPAPARPRAWKSKSKLAAIIAIVGASSVPGSSARVQLAALAFLAIVAVVAVLGAR